MHADVGTGMQKRMTDSKYGADCESQPHQFAICVSLTPMGSSIPAQLNPK